MTQVTVGDLHQYILSDFGVTIVFVRSGPFSNYKSQISGWTCQHSLETHQLRLKFGADDEITACLTVFEKTKFENLRPSSAVPPIAHVPLACRDAMCYGVFPSRSASTLADHSPFMGRNSLGQSEQI